MLKVLIRKTGSKRKGPQQAGKSALLSGHPPQGDRDLSGRVILKEAVLVTRPTGDRLAMKNGKDLALLRRGMGSPLHLPEEGFLMATAPGSLSARERASTRLLKKNRG